METEEDSEYRSRSQLSCGAGQLAHRQWLERQHRLRLPTQHWARRVAGRGQPVAGEAQILALTPGIQLLYLNYVWLHWCVTHFVQVVEQVVVSGCQAVPKADPSGDEFCWRLSFSRGELLLSKHVSPGARMAYVAVKLFWKEKLKSVCPVLRSYHLKTLFYHFLEATSAEEVQDSTTEQLVNRLLQFIQKHLETRTCPHFFISNINLFDFTTSLSLEQTNQDISLCVTALKNSQADENIISTIFSRSSKNMMKIRHFKSQHHYYWMLIAASLVFLNLIFFCAGAIVYVCGFFAVISIVISFFYGAIISVPLILFALLSKKIVNCFRTWKTLFSSPVQWKNIENFDMIYILPNKLLYIRLKCFIV